MSHYFNNHSIHPNAPVGGGGPGHFRIGQLAHPAGHDAHDQKSSALHSVHLADRFHQTVDDLEHVAEYSHRALNLTNAQQIMVAHSRMAVDLKIMRRAIKALENAVIKSGKTSAEPKLQQLEAAYAKAEEVFKTEQGVVARASKLLETEHNFRTGFLAGTTAKVGDAMLRFEHALQGSSIARGLSRTNRIILNPKFSGGLQIAGAAIEAVEGWQDSNAETSSGKAINATLSAEGSLLVLPFSDFVLPKGYRQSELYQGTAAALTGISEALVTGNGIAMAKFHERSKRGDYGVIMKESSEAGDYWAEKGLLGGLSEFFEALKYSIKSWGGTTESDPVRHKNRSFDMPTMRLR
jgi:hypothetical protein